MSFHLFTISMLGRTDRQAFAQFEQRNRTAFEQFNRARDPNYYTPLGLDDAFERLLTRQARRELQVWVARHHQGHWLGRAILFANRTQGQHWGLLAYQTDLDHCRLGVATQLVRQCVVEAVAQGHAWLQAQVTHDNEASIAVLTRCGFRLEGPDEVVDLARGPTDTLKLRRVVHLPRPVALHGANVSLPS